MKIKNKLVDISVVMSAHTMNLDWLELSIESILKQTFKEFEFIIINDSPEDINLKKFLTNYQILDKRILLITNEKNIGFPKSINKAILNSKGKYIVRMDSDDISEINRLKLQYTFMEENNHIDISGTNARIINSEGNIVGHFIRPSHRKSIRKYIFHQNPLIHPTYIVKREVYIKLNCYEDITPGQDYEFLSRAFLNNYEIGNLNFYGLNYRVGHNSLSTNYETAFKQLSLSSRIRKRLKFGYRGKTIFNEKPRNELLNRYFKFLYSIQLKFLLKFKKSNLLFKIIYLGIIFFLTLFHPLLTKEMFHTIIAKFINLKSH